MNNFDLEPYLTKFNQFLELRDLAKNTAKSYNSFLMQYFYYIDSVLSKNPENVTHDEIRTYLIYLKNIRKLAATSINAHNSQLRTFYTYVINKPLDKFLVPFMKTTRKLPVIYSKSKILNFIDTLIHIRHKTIVALLYSSGLRVSELRYIRYDDVSKDNMQIHISKTKTRTDRYVILSKKMLKLLTEYWLKCGKPKGFLFPGTKLDEPISAYVVTSIFKNHSQKTGLHLTPHLMRHHFGTHLYEDGYDLLIIQKLLGHKSINSTTIYVQLANPKNLNVFSLFDTDVEISYQIYF
jgi:site-specific recombinase XerD